jgi:hypothetical protein
MSRTGWSPGTVPYGAGQTVYLVVDRFNSGSVYRETEVERTDLETVIDDFLTGQFNDAVRVVAFNTLEHWANDVSKDIAQLIQLAATSLANRCLSISETSSRVMPRRRGSWHSDWFETNDHWGCRRIRTKALNAGEQC